MTRLGFLDQLSENSAGMYLSYYRGYLRTVFGLRENEIPSRNEMEGLCDRYFSAGRNYQEDVARFFESMKGRAPTSIRTSTAAVKTLLSENNVELPTRFWKGLSRRTKGSRARTLDHIPNNSEIRQLLMEMAIQGRAFYIVLATSGMRFGEALQLRLGDIDLRADPVRITLRGEYTKTGDSRFTFITREAREWVEKWLPQREAYIRRSADMAQKSLGYEKTLDDRIFPFSKNVAQEMFTNAVRRVPGLYQKDSSTGRATVHPHTLRKFFRTQLGKVNVDFAEALMGHGQYLTLVYRRHTVEDLSAFYKQNEALLMFLYDETQLTDLVRRETKGANEVINFQTAKISALEDQQNLLLRRQESTEAQMKRLGDELGRLTQAILKQDEEEEAHTRLLAETEETVQAREKWQSKALGKRKPTAEAAKGRPDVPG